MLLTAIGTDRHLHTSIDQTNIASIHSRLYSFINEIEINSPLCVKQPGPTGQQSQHWDEKGVWINKRPNLRAAIITPKISIQSNCYIK